LFEARRQDAIKRSHRCIKCWSKLQSTCCQVINLSLFWLLLHVCDYMQLPPLSSLHPLTAPGAEGVQQKAARTWTWAVVVGFCSVVAGIIAETETETENLRGSWQRLERLGHLKIAAVCGSGKYKGCNNHFGPTTPPSRHCLLCESVCGFFFRSCANFYGQEKQPPSGNHA